MIKRNQLEEKTAAQKKKEKEKENPKENKEGQHNNDIKK